MGEKVHLVVTEAMMLVFVHALLVLMELVHHLVKGELDHGTCELFGIPSYASKMIDSLVQIVHLCPSEFACRKRESLGKH